MLHLDEPGASLHKCGRRLVVRKGGRALAQARAKDIERVAIIGNAALTSGTLGLLLRRGIDTVAERE